MNRVITLFLSLGLGLILICCSNKDEINSLKKKINFDETKLLLSNTKDQNNPISKIDYLVNTTQLTFEDGTIVSLDNNQIDHIDVDSTNWLATFHFTDNSTVTSYFIGNLSISNSNIFLDPYEKSPLTAIARIETPIKGLFKIIVHGKGIGGISISKTFNAFTNSHEIPILGLYQNYANQVEFVFMNQQEVVRNSKIITIQTKPIPLSPSIKINVNALGADYNGIYIITSLRLGFDQAGEVRWCYTAESNNQLSFMQKLSNGNTMVVSNDVLSMTELTMVGQTVKTYSIPKGIHHDIIEMPSGNFLVTANSNSSVSIEDLVVEVDRTNGNIIKSWNMYDLLDPTRKTLPDINPNDWFHMNSLFYDATDNSIIVSGRSQSVVVKIDYATGSLKWILGNPNFWASSFSNYLFTPVNSAGEAIDVSSQDFWPYGQHAVQRLPNGNIIMYDDGDYRGYYDNQNVPQGSYSRGVEYAIDEQAKTIRLVWEFDYNKSKFTEYTGYIQQLPNSHRVIAYMDGVDVNMPTGPKIVEIDTNNQVLFDADINPGSFYYRGWKMDLYQGLN